MLSGEKKFSEKCSRYGKRTSEKNMAKALKSSLVRLSKMPLLFLLVQILEVESNQTNSTTLSCETSSSKVIFRPLIHMIMLTTELITQ